ncbi:hypothetical protein EW146_g6859 [Bondarzewia mesenterica]|uniref:HMG box domain-containing protein n=1 Tax=Bondarzewia mesenterica TaxID=1095465 RepID=A0A4S4LN19_9AGAM|nr:hypothetical protein EW146_g6859 [Bondarzewia mesenterica]
MTIYWQPHYPTIPPVLTNNVPSKQVFFVSLEWRRGARLSVLLPARSPFSRLFSGTDVFCHPVTPTHPSVSPLPPPSSLSLSSVPSRTTESRSLRNDPSHIKRPMNAFMLFRRAFLADRKNILDQVETDNRHLSRLVGCMWKLMSKDEQQPWYDQAAALKDIHKNMFPQYRYAPVMRERKKRRTKRNGPEDLNRIHRIAELLHERKSEEEVITAVHELDRQVNDNTSSFSGSDSSSLTTDEPPFLDPLSPPTATNIYLYPQDPGFPPPQTVPLSMVSPMADTISLAEALPFPYIEPCMDSSIAAAVSTTFPAQFDSIWLSFYQNMNLPLPSETDFGPPTTTITSSDDPFSLNSFTTSPEYWKHHDDEGTADTTNAWVPFDGTQPYLGSNVTFY